MIEVPITTEGIGLVLSTTDDEECSLNLPPEHDITSGHLYVKAFKKASDGGKLSAQKAGLQVNDLIVCVDGTTSVSRSKTAPNKGYFFASPSEIEMFHTEVIEEMIAAIRNAKGLVILTLLRKVS